MLTAHFFPNCRTMFRYLPLAAVLLSASTFAQNTPVTANPNPNNGNAFDLTLTSLDSSKPDDEIDRAHHRLA